MITGLPCSEPQIWLLLSLEPSLRSPLQRRGSLAKDAMCYKVHLVRKEVGDITRLGVMMICRCEPAVSKDFPACTRLPLRGIILESILIRKLKNLGVGKRLHFELAGNF